MKTSSVLLSLAAAASAIDIRMFQTGNDCNGGTALVCTNMNPNNCCGRPSGGFSSIGFYGIPLEWTLEVRGWEGGNCARQKTGEVVNLTNFRCLRNGPYTGAGYGFRNKRRDTGEDVACTGQAEKECTGTQRPDLLETADGRKYSLVDLSDEQMLELVEQEENGSISEAFQKLEITE